MKTILITGAAGNLGSAVVSTFTNSGYRVIATVQNQEQLETVKVTAPSEVYIVNLADETATASFVSGILKAHGRIDGALMLVGGFTAGNLPETSGADVKKQLELNFDTAYHVARPLLSHMMGNDYGRLVFVGARPALEPAAGKGLVAYSLSKSLLFKLAELINAEAKGKNVTATVVVPSTIDTPLNRQSMPDANSANWVTAAQIADIMEMICSGTGLPLRESVLKVYNNS